MSHLIVQHQSGVKFHTGRNPPRVIQPHLTMEHYMDEGLPLPPAGGVDYTDKCMPALRKMYMNDTLGDCVNAWMLRARGIWTGEATGNPILFTDDQAVKTYSETGGYVPGDPSTDQGNDIQTALNIWMSKGIPPAPDPTNHALVGYLGINAQDDRQVRLAIFLFEHWMAGVGLPQAWVDTMNTLKDGTLWSLAGPPIPQNGHCFGSMKYDANSNYTIATWTYLPIVPANAVNYYMAPAQGGELYVCLSNELVTRAKKRAPNGFKWGQLQADIAALKYV